MFHHSDTSADKNTPTRIGIASDWTHIALSIQAYSVLPHTCGLRSGKLFCWGHNGFGQLGDGTNGSSYFDTSADKNTPTLIGSNSDWTHISLGNIHTCGIRSGNLYCWGGNDYGQLGDGTNSNKNIPTRVGIDSDWTHVSSGARHTCGVRNTGELYCWGNDYGGELGDGILFNHKNIPTRVGSNFDWTHVSSGYLAACGIRNNGELFCWGGGMLLIIVLEELLVVWGIILIGHRYL